jgi:hypothetical protein
LSFPLDCGGRGSTVLELGLDFESGPGSGDTRGVSTSTSDGDDGDGEPDTDKSGGTDAGGEARVEAGDDEATAHSACSDARRMGSVGGFRAASCWTTFYNAWDAGESTSAVDGGAGGGWADGDARGGSAGGVGR